MSIPEAGDNHLLPVTDSFEAALDLLRDWRLDRYYASRLKLFDTVVRKSDTAITKAEMSS